MASIYQRGETWWIRYYPSPGSKAVQYSLKTKDKTVAKFKKNEIENQLTQNQNPIAHRNKSPQEVLEEYKNYALKRKTEATLAADVKRLQSFLNDSKPRRLSDISIKAVTAHINKRIENDKIGFWTANHTIKNLNTFLNFALRMGYVHENPIKYIDRYPEDENPEDFYNLSEIESLLRISKALDKDLYYFHVLGFYMGGRPAEILTMEWSNFQWVNNKVVIQNKPNFRTKTRTFRSIPLNKKLARLVSPIRKEAGFCIFADRDKDNFNMNNAYMHLLNKHGEAVKQAELKDSTLKITRSSFASNLVSAGVSIYKVSKWLGHSSVKTTEKHYAYLAPNRDDADIDRI